MIFLLAFCPILRGCLTMAASIFFVCVTRGVFADEVVGGLDRMTTRALLPNVV